jgi:hypothetical protein
MKVEEIFIKGTLCAIVFTIEGSVRDTEFGTDPNSLLQVGQIAINPDRPVRRHRHNPIERDTRGTNEVLVVLEGKLTMELFGDRNEVQVIQEVSKGQAILLISGGHAFRSSEECSVLEIKNGPYDDMFDKVYF